MECSCGNISRWELYRMEVVRYVIDKKRTHRPVEGKRRNSSIESKRVVFTDKIITIVCVECGKEGSMEDFNCVDIMREIPLEIIDTASAPKHLVKYMTEL